MARASTPHQPDRARSAARFDALMARVLATNPFYRSRFAAHGWDANRPPRLEDLPALPFTHKAELVEDQARHPPFGSNLTFALDRYTRLHQTSGTTGRPLRWLDTPESWEWWLECWRAIYRAAGVGAGDRVFVAFSFGPFIGFWSAFDAAQTIGATAIPGGGLTSRQRLEMIRELEATVLICTPTYALRLGEVAAAEGMDLASGSVRVAIHAGEPGASIPTVRERLARVWGARIVDHPGATEVGAWGHGCDHDHAVHVNEHEFVAEVVDPATGAGATPDAAGVTAGELVLTNLGRVGSPVIRYRTGDLVEVMSQPCPCGRSTAALRGGVLGRTDQMVVVRGVNVFPSAIENVIREFAAIDEFEVRIRKDREMAALDILVEIAGDDSTTAGSLASRLHDVLHLRPSVTPVPAGTLPRYELKARRFTFVDS